MAPASYKVTGAVAVRLDQSYDPLNGDTMPRMFGTDGVRGLANVDITADLALQLGEAPASSVPPGERTAPSPAQLSDAIPVFRVSSWITRSLRVLPAPAWTSRVSVS